VFLDCFLPKYEHFAFWIVRFLVVIVCVHVAVVLDAVCGFQEGTVEVDVWWDVWKVQVEEIVE
jgi:hypothetical protein